MDLDVSEEHLFVGDVEGAVRAADVVGAGLVTVETHVTIQHGRPQRRERAVGALVEFVERTAVEEVAVLVDHVAGHGEHLVSDGGARVPELLGGDRGGGDLRRDDLLFETGHLDGVAVVTDVRLGGGGQHHLGHRPRPVSVGLQHLGLGTVVVVVVVVFDVLGEMHPLVLP